MSQTQKNQGLDPQLAAAIPSGDQVYDAIMGTIEPELLSKNLPSLVDKYGNETAGARAERMQRYQAAFRRYDETYGRWIHNLRTVARDQRADALQKAEVRVQQEDAEQLSTLENQFAV